MILSLPLKMVSNGNLPNSVLNGPAFCSGGLVVIFCIFSGKISLSLLNRRDSLYYRYWSENFSMGSTKYRGIKLCVPYAYLSGKLSQEILKNMVHRAGLRAQIIEDGIKKCPTM